MEEMLDRLFGHLRDSVKTSIGRAPGEIGAELKQMGAHGAHELAAAIFTGSSFVMYPRGSHEDHGVHGPEMGKEEPEAMDGPEQQRNLGRSM